MVLEHKKPSIHWAFYVGHLRLRTQGNIYPGDFSCLKGDSNQEDQQISGLILIVGAIALIIDLQLAS